MNLTAQPLQVHVLGRAITLKWLRQALLHLPNGILVIRAGGPAKVTGTFESFKRML